MPCRLSLLFCWLLLLNALPVRAVEQVEDLYSSVVPVADRSAGALQSAARQALEEVLIKVSGSRSVTELSATQEALGAAREMLRQYSYVQLEGGGDLAARVEFDPPQIRALLAQAGAPLWTANRPAVLIWLVREDASGRAFVSAESDPDLVAALSEGFRRRGVPVRFPLLDLADSTALDPDTAWQLPVGRLQAAAGRYGLDDVLAGRLVVTGSGDYLGDLVYQSSSGRLQQTTGRMHAESLAAAGVELVVSALATRYAVPASAASADAVFVEVEGVRSYADYAAVLGWMQGLELVTRVDIAALEGERLVLRVLSNARPERLAEIVGLNASLVAVPGTAPGRLHYQWRP